MTKIKAETLFLAVIVVIISLIINPNIVALNWHYQSTALAKESYKELESSHEELYEMDEGYFNLVDEEGNVLLKTGRILSVGNKFLNEDNELYKVVEVVENEARAEFVEEVDLGDSLEKENKETQKRSVVAEAEQGLQNTIGIYHSHGAESYEPSDGSESIDEGGGILQVGKTLKDSLENHNINAIWNKRTHVPHDAGAYARSRRTVEELLKHNPDALIDVHRDAAPREEYKVDMGFDEIVQILLVVGQQQPNFEENKNFAESLKAVGDEKYSGLIKGVLYADGSYNQDLHPRNLLIEVGGHENTRESAESSVNLFGRVLNTRLYEDGGEAGPIVDQEGGVAGRAARGVIWVIGLTAIIITLYLAVNYKSLDEIKLKVKEFITKEFSKK